MLFVREGATHKVVVGPAVAVGDGFTPVTTLALSTADEAEVILHDNGTVVDISGYTWAAITTADGYYHLTLQTGISNTIGHMTVVVNDDSLCLPLRADFTVLATEIYDALFASTATGFNSSGQVVAASLVGHTAQTGDSFALIGATGSGLTSLAQASVATEARLAELDAANLPADIDAIRASQVLASGTSDSGSTTTMVDAARTEADNDYWKGDFIVFTSGNIDGQVRLITGFTAASDTITFAPATTQAVATQTYEIIPAARVDLQLWLGTAANALVGGAVDADVSAMQANTVTASALATDAVNEIRDSIISDATTFAGANIDATISSRATPAQVNTEVLDVLNTDTFAEPGQGTPGATISLAAKIGYLYKSWRNRTTQTSSQYSLYNDDATTIDQKATFSDDTTTADRGEIATGP